jgi:SsrA-binding protein
MGNKKIIAKNKKARFEYEILETYEAGIVLKGTEVKSLRQGNVHFLDSYVSVNNGEAFINSLNIAEYKYGNIQNHDPTRERKLLLHKKEIKKLESKVQEKGLTLIPLSIYFKNGKVKIEIGVCRGKKLYDKRKSIKERDLDRQKEIDRQMEKY